MAHAQEPAKPPAAPPNPNQLFQAPQFQAPKLQPPGKTQFKWQDPDLHHRSFLTPPSAVHTPAANSGLDPGIFRKPQGFAQYPSHPAPHSNLYPDLKFQPVEIAKLEAFSVNPQVKAEPIPLVFPNARLEPIPTTWEQFRMIPIETGQSSNP